MIDSGRSCWHSAVPCIVCRKPCATDGRQLWCVDELCELGLVDTRATVRREAARSGKSVHFMSENPAWGTPQAFFDRLNAEFHFTLDVCALPETALCHRYCIPPTGAEYHTLWPGEPLVDGLAQDWGGEICWMNPPYGSAIGPWIKKAHESSKRGAVVVALLPSRTDTRWWHDHCMQAEQRFVKGRLTFKGAPAPAPFPSVVVVFRSGPIPHPKTLLNK